MTNTKNNIFAIEYLELMTECQKELQKFRKQKSFILFGKDIVLTDEKASEIIQCSIEEYENTIVLKYSKEDLYASFVFSTYEDCLHAESYLDDTYNPEKFFLSYYEHELEDLTNDQIKEIFNSFNQDQLKYFSAMYYTAVEAKIIEDYKSKYISLKSKYPDVPFYPVFDFNYDLTDYYESSTC